MLYGTAVAGIWNSAALIVLLIYWLVGPGDAGIATFLVGLAIGTIYTFVSGVLLLTASPVREAASQRRLRIALGVVSVLSGFLLVSTIMAFVLISKNKAARLAAATVGAGEESSEAVGFPVQHQIVRPSALRTTLICQIVFSLLFPFAAFVCGIILLNQRKAAGNEERLVTAAGILAVLCVPLIPSILAALALRED